jgi:hypothetical protein
MGGLNYFTSHEPAAQFAGRRSIAQHSILEIPATQLRAVILQGALILQQGAHLQSGTALNFML